MILRTTLAIGAVVIGMTAAIAQQDAVKARKDIMEANAHQFYDILGRTQRGQIPYDQAKVDAAFTAIANEAVKLGPAFATNVMPAKQSDYDASVKIWQNKADFDAKTADYIKAVTENRNAAKDVATLKVAYENVNKSCNACHELYRVKNR